MRHTVNPRQGRLFDPFAGIIPPLGRKRLEQGWQTLFRQVLLALMPVAELGKHFDPTIGRPTKDLYAVAGLLFLKEMHSWSDEHALDAFLFHTDVQFALNVEPGIDQMCQRSLERYLKLFIEDELAARVQDSLTAALIDKLDLAIDKQRLDSTHVFSNMANFGRTRLMGVAIKRFLTQVKRHHEADYDALAEDLRRRYAPSQGKLFAATGQSPDERVKTRQQVAEDLHALVERFADHAGLCDRPSYRAMATIFAEQCEVVEEKIEVREKTGGSCMQNPSDPDATYDGHKGQGYKVQLAETCSEENDVQLIVLAIPQTAASSDAAAFPEVLAGLKEKGRLPESMQADTAYGSDANVQMAAAEGVELVSPAASTPEGAAPEVATIPSREEASVNGNAPPLPATVEPLTIDDFAMDERTKKVTACPSGRIPLEATYDAQSGTTTIEMKASDCENCPFRKACPMQKKPKGRYRLSYTDKQRRLDERRREEKTDAFKERYAKRSGIESTNSGLKRRLGLGKLRVRGRKAVYHAILLKVAGWNLHQAVAALRKRAAKKAKLAAAECQKVAA